MSSCEEGGSHQFTMPKKRSCCFKLCCCPCWAFMSCAMSNGQSLQVAFLEHLNDDPGSTVSTHGAAFISQVGMHGGNEIDPEMTCLKCGLSRSETEALQAMKDAEKRGFRSSKGPGYFTNKGMSISEPITTNHSRTTTEFPSPTTTYPPPSAPNRSRDRLALPCHDDSYLGTPVAPQRSQEGNPAIAWVASQQAFQIQHELTREV
ncbi:BQ2448_663 [Microbotryum intermedium]|uniref:BQ2448_663 protein n=1 Tax=Microbotryum intermedium TaxID=269621 RepID=A0A238F322_9BASI|nr:BQ2448_663 [Microbotryum intermedium]